MHKDLSVMFRYIPLRSILHNSRLIVNPVSHDGRQKFEICVVPSCIRSGMEINMQKEGISYWQWTAGITGRHLYKNLYNRTWVSEGLPRSKYAM